MKARSTSNARLEDFGVRSIISPVERFKEYQEQSKVLPKKRQAELLVVQEARKKLEEELKTKITDAPMKVFEEVTNSVNSGARAGSKAFFIDKRVIRTDEERWRTKVRHVLNPLSGLPKEDLEKVERRVFGDAETHPDWLVALPEEQRAALREKMVAWKGRK